MATSRTKTTSAQYQLIPIIDGVILSRFGDRSMTSTPKPVPLSIPSSRRFDEPTDHLSETNRPLGSAPFLFLKGCGFRFTLAQLETFVADHVRAQHRCAPCPRDRSKSPTLASAVSQTF